jgi:hypothetical protein
LTYLFSKVNVKFYNLKQKRKLGIYKTVGTQSIACILT